MYILRILHRTMNVRLGVIGIAAVALESMLMNYIQNLDSIQEEQQWTQYRALGNTTVQSHQWWRMFPNVNSLLTIRQIRNKPLLCYVTDAICVFSSLLIRMAWSTVSNAALRSRRLNNETWPLSDAMARSLTTLIDAVSVEWNCRYSDWLDGKLPVWLRKPFNCCATIRSINFDMNERLDRDWSIVLKNSRIQSFLLDKWRDDCCFLADRQKPFKNWPVAHHCNKWCQVTRTSFYQPRWCRIKSTTLVRSRHN